MLQLFPSLYKKVISFWDLDRDAFACVAGPDIQSRITGAAMDSQEVEVRMKPSEDGILLAVFGEV
jgi:hypothetical protein